MVITASQLRKEYRDTVAVAGIDLDVRPGEVFGFLGPNGAGKTTTVKMLLGLVRPTGGTARVLGCAPGEPRAMRRIGFLPEHFRFPSWLPAFAFMDTHARLYGLGPAERARKIPQLLEKVGLGGRERSRLGEFSKGMQQRVGLAQALLGDPELVFLDEPTSGLDPLGRRDVRDVIRELRQRGVAVFVNSHFLSEVEVTCDRVAIVKKGRVVRAGTLDQLAGASMQLEIRAACLGDEAIAGLARWGRVTSTAPDPAFPELLRVLLSIEREEDLPDINAWLVQGGARVYTFSPQRPSLEELFMKAMADEGLEGVVP